MNICKLNLTLSLMIVSGNILSADLNIRTISADDVTVGQTALAAGNFIFDNYDKILPGTGIFGFLLAAYGANKLWNAHKTKVDKTADKATSLISGTWLGKKLGIKSEIISPKTAIALGLGIMSLSGIEAFKGSFKRFLLNKTTV